MRRRSNASSEGREDSHGGYRGYGGDVFRQTVPDTSSSDCGKARSPTVVSRLRMYCRRPILHFSALNAPPRPVQNET